MDFEILKKAYKLAAKKYHPDVGGSDQEMKRINAAYFEFHEIISSFQLVKSQNRGSIPSDGLMMEMEFIPCSAREYFVSLISLQATLLTDIWAVDRAALCFKQLDKVSRSALPDHPLFCSQVFFTVATLIERLCKAGLNEQAADLLSLASQLARKCPDIVFGYPTRVNDLKKKVKSQESDLKIVIKHPLQAENLLRLKVIDSERFEKAMKRFGARKDDQTQTEETLQEIVNTRGFIQDLPSDRQYKPSKSPARLTPQAGFTSYRIQHLTDDQRAEYFLAFSPGTSTALIEKYLPIRLSSYMCSIVLHYDSVDLDRIGEEIELLSDVLGNRYQFNDVLRFINFVQALPSGLRTTKLKLLKDRDSDAPRSLGISFTIDLSGLVKPSTLPIEASNYYVHSAIEVCSKDCSVSTEIKKADTWNRDLALLKEVSNGAIEKKAREVLWSGKGAPEQIIEAVQPLVNQLLELGQKMDPLNTGELQLGYWINALSTAFAKVKNWKKAGDWIDHYFSLDKHYQDRLNTGDRKTLLKRLERCKRESEKAA